MVHTVPDGFQVKGVSTYYNDEGKPVGQWVKSVPDKERQLDAGEAFKADSLKTLNLHPQAKATRYGR